MGVLLGILVMVVLFFVFWIIGKVLEPLVDLFKSVLPQTAQEMLIIILGIALLIGALIIAYRESYVTGRRKKWYFWLCLSAFIGLFLVILSLGLK